jgi:4-amino-4-deoxy-L-arabinose transferase-like glycosyltransferase
LNRSLDRAPGSDLTFSAYLGLAAFLPRLYVAIAWPREPVWDGHYYDFGARRIAAGLGYSDGIGGWHPWCHWPVGYSGLLAGAYRLFGNGPHVATVLGAIIGALLAVVTHRLARYELSPWRARAAGLLCAFHPGLIAYAALVMTEALSALALVVAGFLWVRDREAHPRRGAILFGLTIGLGALVHPSFLAYAPALIVLAGGARASTRGWPSYRDALRRRPIATACAFVPVLPWTLRNCRVMDRCTPPFDQWRLEPRHRLFLAGHRAFRNAARFRRLRGRHRAGRAGRMLARSGARDDQERRRALARARPEEARLYVRS